MSDDWIFWEPNYADIYEINTFDDGNKNYQFYENRWAIFGKWRGKCAVINQMNSAIKINSISQWKLTLLS